MSVDHPILRCAYALTLSIACRRVNVKGADLARRPTKGETKEKEKIGRTTMKIRRISRKAPQRTDENVCRYSVAGVELESGTNWSRYTEEQQLGTCLIWGNKYMVARGLFLF